MQGRQRLPTPDPESASARRVYQSSFPPESSGLVVFRSSDVMVEEMPGDVYVLHVVRNLSRATLTASLEAIWGTPGWRQPWGMVVSFADDATYDGDVRSYEIPPTNKRSIGCSIVTSSQLRRMVIKSIGLGYAAVSKYVMTAHDTLDPAVATQRDAVLVARSQHRTF